MTGVVFRSVSRLVNGGTQLRSLNKLLLASRTSNATLCFSSTHADEATFDLLDKLSLKVDKDRRLTSEQFLDEVKQLVGKDIPDDEFVPPRKAFNLLAAEYNVLLAEFDDIKDRYYRALAETENVRRRGQKQVEDTKIFAVQGFCKDLLEVADILETALGTIKPGAANQTDELKGVLEGISMTKTVLLKTFDKHGLKKVNPEGHKFDPNLHEALTEIPPEMSDYKPGHVGAVMKIGYSLHGRPIRPAQVAVVKS